MLRVREYPKNKNWMVWLIEEIPGWDAPKCLMYGAMLPDDARRLAGKIGAKIRKIKSNYSLTKEQETAWKAKNLPKPGEY